MAMIKISRKFIAIIVIVIIGFLISLPLVKYPNILQVKEESEVTKNTINYFEDSSGYLAKPAKDGEYPGIVMIHEWWGLNEHIKNMASELASEGYVVLAVDLYEGKVATTPEEARQLVSSLDQEKALRNLRSAVSYLRTHENVRIVASLGWCFGGGQSLQLALSGEVLDATVIYYGDLVTNESQLSMISWPVLGIFGDQDAVIPVSQVEAFKASLDNLGIENEIYIYPGVGHAFANPSSQAFASKEAQDAWQKTLVFLNEHLKK